MMTQGKHSTKLITLNGDILSFQCKYSHHDGDSRRRSELTCRRLSFKKETNCFMTQNDDTPIYKDSSPDVDVVLCSTAIDVRRKVVVPCILLKQWKKKASCYSYKLITFTSPTKAELHVKFNIIYELQDGLTIFQGPSILWRHENTIYFASAQTSEVRSIPIQMSLVFLGEFCGKVIVLGSPICLKEEANCPIGLHKDSTIVAYSVEDGKMFNGTCIIPNAYSSVVQCALVLSAEEVDGHMKVNMVAATNKKQLVCFENGNLRDVCQLPFEGPECVKVANTGNSGLLFVVSFNQGNVCAVWNDTFQVAACWSDISSVLIDDFVGCGTDQVLLVFQDQNPPDSVTNFIMTDLCGTMYSMSEESEPSDAAQGNYLCTIQALESRLQSGLTLLQDYQRDVDVKDRVLLQSTNALADLVLAREHIISKTEQEGLVSLWEDADEEEAVEKETQPGSEQQPFLVEKLWQRYIEDRLVVGVLLTKEDGMNVIRQLSVLSSAVASCLSSESIQVLERVLERASICLLLEGQVPAVIQSQSRVHWLPTDPPEPVPKRKRMERAVGSSWNGTGASLRLVLTTSCELSPLLTCAPVKCPIMLHYVLNKSSSAGVQPQAPKALQCGWVSISLPDATQGLHHPSLLQAGGCSGNSTAESEEDLFSLLAFLDSWSFLISSPEHSLCDVGQWLQEELGCEMVKRSPQYLLGNPAGLSATLIFHWQKRSPFLGELVIYCRGQLALLRFLPSLCGFLPASSHIQPLRRGTSEAWAQDVGRALEREVLALRDGLSCLLDSPTPDCQGSGGSGAPRAAASVAKVDDLQRLREEWQRDIEGSRRKVGPLVAMDRYRLMNESLLQVQQQVDIGILQGTESKSGFSH